MYLGNNAALLGCQEYFNRCAAAGSPIGAAQTPTAYDNAASFNGTNQFLSNSSFAQSGSFTLSFWVNTSPLGLIGVINKGLATSNVSDWALFKTGTSLCFAGSSAGQQSPAIATISLTQWNFVVVTYDATSLVKSIQVNNGTVSSNAGTTAFSNTYSQINLSCLNGSYFSGSMAGVGYWNRVLSASEVTQLFNSGAGRTYASLDTGLRTNLVSWWALNQNSVTADSHGTNTLTNNGTVTAPNIGPVVTSLADPRQLIIDFAQGIDRLGLWNSMVCWPLRSSQNGRSGTTAFSLGGLGRFDGTLAGSTLPIWGANGIQSGGVALSARVNVPLSIRTSINNGASIFGVISNASDDNYSVFRCEDSADSNPYYPSLFANQANGLGVVPVVTRGGARYFQVTRGGAFSPGFSSVAGVFRPTSQANYRNGTLISDETGLAAMNPDSQVAVDYAVICARGNGPITGGGVISPFSLVSSQIFTDIQLTQLNSLYRQTLGLGLGLP
jgi:hypothetical protein